jgi:hypothetical protein
MLSKAKRLQFISVRDSSPRSEWQALVLLQKPMNIFRQLAPNSFR